MKNSKKSLKRWKKNENGYGKGITKAPAIAHEQLKNEKLKISEDILTSVCNNMHS